MFLEGLLAKLQYLLPQRALTRLVYRLMRNETRWLKNTLIRVISRLAGVNWDEAVSRDPGDYRHFNAFFTRALRDGVRPSGIKPSILTSPCDGKISEIGTLDGNSIMQAKGHVYTLESLLAGDPACAQLVNGSFATIYLSPRDYHRVHMPLEGRLQRMIHVPGKLFSVAPYTVRQIPGLFALNERVVSIFDSPKGPFAVVLVGAMLVASMETVWAGEVTPSPSTGLTVTDYAGQEISLQQGEEMGRFNMGSTVILVLPEGATDWDAELLPGDPVMLGERLGRLRRN